MDSGAYLFLSLICYAVGAVHVLVHVITRRRLLTTLTIASTLLGFAFHTAALSQRWTEGRTLPGDGSSGRGVALGVGDRARLSACLPLHSRRRAGAVCLPVRLSCSSWWRACRPRVRRPDSVLRGLFMPVHTVLAVFGYGALFAAFTMGVLYLIQGARAAVPLAAAVLLHDPEPRAVGHHRGAERHRGVRLPDPGDTDGLPLEHEPERTVLDGRPEGVGGAGRHG